MGLVLSVISLVSSIQDTVTGQEKTQWLDALVAKGIIKKNEPDKPEEEEPTLFPIEEPKKAVSEIQSEDEDDLDSDDEQAFLAYRMKRLTEMQIEALKAKFGSVIEISKQDYVDEVNKAGPEVWVVVHIYQPG